MALRAQGLGTEEIAQRIGGTVTNVRSLERYARRRSRPLPVEAIETLLPERVTLLLGPEARKRNLTLNRLIIQLLTTIADDNMVGAVLDDRGVA